MDWTEFLAQQTVAPGSATAPAATPAPAQAPSAFAGFDWTFAAIMVGMLVVLYFMSIRPQRQEEKRKKELLAALKKGDQVVTTSGMIGSVSAVKDDTVVINIGDGTRVEFLRSAVASIRDKK